MNDGSPRGARRWLAAQLLQWAAWENTQVRFSSTGHGSLVGYLMASADLSDEEKAKVEQALSPRPGEPL